MESIPGMKEALRSRFQNFSSLTISEMETDPGFKAAMEEAEAGFKEGGVPIGASLVAADGTILGRGHNMRIQKSSPTLHVRNQLPRSGEERSW
jgi:tRNA(Arg) A34 adenosine deaminase TadA